MKNKNIRKIFQIIMIVCIVIIVVQLAIIGVTYFVNESKVIYSESINQLSLTVEGYVAVGSSDFKNSDDYDYTGGIQKAYISKYDFDQNILWNMQYEEGYNSIFNSVAVYDNYYYAVGSIESTDEQNKSGLRDALIVKYNRFGELVDAKTFQVVGDSTFMKIRIVDGSLYVVGQSILPPMDVGVAPNGGAILIKYSTDLNEIWRANFGGAKSAIYNDVAIYNDAIYVVGKDAANTGLIVKYDLSGNREFVKNYSFTDKIGFSSIVVSNDKIFVAGSKGLDTETDDISTEALFLTYDLDGNLLDGKTYDAGLMSRYNVLKIVGNQLWAVGYTASLDFSNSTEELNVFNYDAIVAKYNLDGEEISTETISGDKDDYYTDIISLNDNNYIVSYSNSSSLNFGANGKDFIPNLIKE